MNIDWAGTGAMLLGEGTWLAAFAVIGAAWLGKNRLESWRK